MSTRRRRVLISGRWSRASSDTGEAHVQAQCNHLRRPCSRGLLSPNHLVARKKRPRRRSQPLRSLPQSWRSHPRRWTVYVGQKVKFSAAAKDAAGNPIEAKPSVWFAAPFDLAGADESGEVTFHAPGVVTVGAVGSLGRPDTPKGECWNLEDQEPGDRAAGATDRCGQRRTADCRRAHPERRSSQ